MIDFKPPSIVIFISTIVAAVFIAYAIGFFCAKLDSYKFYDGEGNVIPYHVVDSLVRSQFVHESAAERDTINKYFK